MRRSVVDPRRPRGGAIGPRVGKYIPSELMETGLVVVFGTVGAIVLGLEVLI